MKKGLSTIELIVIISIVTIIIITAFKSEQKILHAETENIIHITSYGQGIVKYNLEGGYTCFTIFHDGISCIKEN